MGAVGENGTRTGGDEYLSVAEVAERLRLSPKRVRNLMASGGLRVGYHFFRRPGIAPRFKWSRVVEWLETGSTPAEPPRSVRRRTQSRVDLSLVPTVREKGNGL